MKKSVIFFVALFVLVIQISFINSGEIVVWGCVGTPSACSTVASNSCYCDSVSGVVSCTLAGFLPVNYCAIEGDYYVMAGSSCQSSIPSVPTYVDAFNINWDGDSADCTCRVGAGKWALPGIRTGDCCGDDASEFYISASSSQNKNGIAFCCDNSNDYVVGMSCCNLANYAGSETGKSCDGSYSCCASTTDYSKRSICVSTCSEILNARWVDNSQNPITRAGVGAIVNPLAVTEYFGSKKINFTIYDDENQVVDFFGDISQTSDNKTVSWKVPETGTYYFEAISSDGSVVKMESNLLQVDNASFNLPPFANIYRPIRGTFFLVNSSISFSANGSYDQDDLITSTIWELDDGKTSNQWEFQESYSTRGQKEIKLTVSGGEAFEGRNREDSDWASIMVCDGPGIYVFANISSPVEGVPIDQKNWTFNSQGSYAKQCSDNICEVCTSLSPDLFKWELFRLSNGEYGYVMNGYGSSWAVNNLFGVARYKIRLTVEEGEVSESTEREFLVRYLNDPLGLECVEPLRSQWRNFTDDSFFDSLGDCDKGDMGTCCPTNVECINGVCGGCTEDFCEVETNYLCSHYLTENECESFNPTAAKNSVKDKRDDSKTCSETIGNESGCLYSLENCRCEWDEDESQCVSKVDIIPFVCDSAISPEGEVPFNIGTCIYSENTTGDSCDDGFLSYYWNAEWVWAPGNEITQSDLLGEHLSCVSGSRAVVCPSQIKLSFFGMLELVATLIVITIGYYLIFLFRKKKKKVKSNKSSSIKKKIKKKKIKKRE